MIMNLKKENLFLIEHINEEEKLLEKQNKESESVIKRKEEEIALYKENLDRLYNQLQAKKQRKDYFENQKNLQTIQKPQKKGEKGDMLKSLISMDLKRKVDLEKLKITISKMTQIIEPGKEVNKDMAKQLSQIEYKLFYLTEARDFIVQKDP